MDESQGNVSLSNKTLGETSMNTGNSTSPDEIIKSHTPARRTTRRTSHMENTEEDNHTPVPTRRSTRTRKNTIDEATYDVTTSLTGSNRSKKTQQEPQPGTPKRITRRSASIQSDDGVVASQVPLLKQPKEETIEEVDETPQRRVTRASSVTSDDGKVHDTPSKRRGRKSMAKLTVETVLEEPTADDVSPSRPVTRSMSNSPANVTTTEKVSPVKPKSPLVTAEENNKSVVKAEENDEPDTTSHKQINYSVVEESFHGFNNSTDLTPNRKNNKTPKKGTPVMEKIEEVVPETPKSAKKDKEKTPTSAKSSKTPQKTPGSIKSPHFSPSIESTHKKKTEYLSKTPQPTKEKQNVDDVSVFSKSWSQPVIGSASKTSKIDKFDIKKLSPPQKNGTKSPKSVEKRKSIQVSSSSSDDSDTDNDFDAFVDDKAEDMGKGYESGDSKNSDEQEMADENRMHEELGESIGSRDTDEDDEDEEDDENGSFIVTDEETELLSYSDDDEHIEDEEQNVSKNKKLDKKGRKSAPARILDSSEDESEEETKEIEAPKSESKLPKIKLHKPKSPGHDTSINETIFNPDKTAQSEKMDVDNNSPQKDEEDEPTPAEIAAAERSLINLAVKSGRISSVSSKSSSDKNVETKNDSSDQEMESEESTQEQLNTSVNISVKVDTKTEPSSNEKSSKKRKRSSVSLNESSVEIRPTKKPKMNVSVVSEQKLDTILEKCNELLRAKKEEKKLNKKLHKKEKEEKKKRKELLKQKQGTDEENAKETTENDESGKKKKKKQRIGRKYNQEITDGTSTAREEAIKKALKHSVELLEKKRERKRLKKLAKLEKAKENGEPSPDMKQKKQEKENADKKNNNEKPVKKTKTLLTAYEVKQQLLASQNIETTSVPSITVPDKENEKHEEQPKPKQKKKKAEKKVLAPTNESNNSDEGGSPPKPTKKQTLGILNDKGCFKANEFVVEPVTPEAARLKRNRGFVEEPATPAPIGFKVKSMMPEGEDFVKKIQSKKRKRHEIDIPEPSRLPPKPVWTKSGAFIEEPDNSNTHAFIPLSTASNAATQFGIAVLNGKKKKHQNKTNSSQGLSSFKMKALYKSRANVRESSDGLARKLEKQKHMKRFNA